MRVVAPVCAGNGEVFAHHNYWFPCRCQPVKNVDLDWEPRSLRADRGFLFVYAATITAHTALIPLQSSATQINENMSIWILVCFRQCTRAQAHTQKDAPVVYLLFASRCINVLQGEGVRLYLCNTLFSRIIMCSQCDYRHPAPVTPASLNCTVEHSPRSGCMKCFFEEKLQHK